MEDKRNLKNDKMNSGAHPGDHLEAYTRVKPCTQSKAFASPVLYLNSFW